MAAISDKKVTINGLQHTVTAVDGMDRVEINNKLHHIGDQIMKLRMEQDRLINMRNKLDQQIKDSTLGDLFLEMFSL